MKRAKEDEVKGNIEERLMIKQFAAHCPFTNFGPCVTDRCAFFVVTDLYTGDSECAIRASYFQQLLTDMTSRAASLFSVKIQEASLEISVHPVVQNLVSALRYLDGLSVDPGLAPHLKSKIRKMKRDLQKALKTFSERKI